MQQTLASQAQTQFNRLTSTLNRARTPSERTASERTASERGASLVEYSLLIALIAVVVIASVTLFGGSVNSNFSVVASEVTG